MTSPVLTSRLQRDGKEYLLQTSWVESQKRIITALFSEGKFLSQQAFECAKTVNETELASLLKAVHQHRFQETARLFELSQNPNGHLDEAEVRFLLGEAFYQQGLLAEAEAELEKALELSSEKPPAIKLLAQIYLDAKDYSRAQIHLQSAVEKYPKYADFRLLLARALAEMEKFSWALREIDEAIRINSYYPEAYLEYGLILLGNVIKRKEYELTLGLPGRAVQHFQRAAQLNPAYLNQEFQAGLESLKKGDHAAALNLLRAVRDRTKEKHRNYLHEYYLQYLTQNGALEQKNLSEQIKVLQKLVEQNPAYADLHFQLGTIYMLLCRYITQKAVFEYQKALQLNPHYKKAERNMKLCENDLKGIDLLLKAML